MPWRGSSSHYLPLNGTVSLPLNRSFPGSLPQTGNHSFLGERVNNTEFLPGPFGISVECHMSPALTICLIVCYGITMVLGLVGNSCLICIIARRRERANVTSILICNLSVSDIMVCAFCLPFTVTYTLMDHWVFGAVLCRLVPFIQCMSVTVSVLSLVLIALERHQLIINPSGWKPSIPQAYVAVLVIWMLACFTSLPFLVFHLLTKEPYTNLPQPKLQTQTQAMSLPALPPQPESYPSPPPYAHSKPSSHLPIQPSLASSPGPSSSPLYHPYSPSHLEACLEHWPSHHYKLVYTTWLLLFQYCVPLLLVLFCYIRVFVRLRRRNEMMERNRTPENQRLTQSRRINVMLVAVVTAFALCWLPLTVFNEVSDWNQDALPVCHHNLLFSLCHLLAMSSTCVNPVIYGFLNSNFRQEVREALRRCQPMQEDDYGHFPLSTVQTEVSRISMRRNNSV